MSERSIAHNADPFRLQGETFVQDPFAYLRQESQRLYGVYHDAGTSEKEKDHELDGYFRTIESLDRAAFPALQGEVKTGLVPGERYGREMNYVDTYNILHQHKALFRVLFANLNPDNYKGEHGEIEYQQLIVSNIAREISMTMPYGRPTQRERGGILPVSKVDNALCTQHALTAQILMQAFGIRSRLSKNYFADQKDLDAYGPDFLGGDHAGNVVTMGASGERVYIFDPTNPQVNARGEWTFGFFRMGQQAADGSWLTTQNGMLRKYTERNDMFWTILRQKAAR